MKILVTGASGFVGGHLCETLLKNGHQVFALMRNFKKDSTENTNQIGQFKHSQLNVITGDIDTQDLLWTEVLPENLDACIHTAGIVHSYNEEEFYRINSEGTAYLVNNLQKKQKNLNFILISSLAAAGPANANQKKTEDDIDFPVSKYGRSKKLAEEKLYQLAPSSWKISIIRPPMVIGPRDTAVLDIFKMVKKGVVLLPGMDSLSKQYSFVCVFDLVETIMRTLDKNQTNFLYSSHPQVITFRELILEIKKQMKKKWILYFPLPFFFIRLIALMLSFIHKIFPHKMRLTPDKCGELKARSWICDGSKSEAELGQVYNYNLERTISETLIDYQRRKWL